jgi:membrane fusion protein, heavy metal efflux system
MRRHQFDVLQRVTVGLAVIAGAVVGIRPGGLHAHENHAPLPTKGVKIVGDQIMISAKGREAIGLTTAKITLANLSRLVGVNARIELPWRQQAMIASLVPGKIEQVLARPGEAVVAGQELARVVSMELESLQSELLQATTEAAFAERVLNQRNRLDQTGTVSGKSLLEARAVYTQKIAQREVARQKLLALGFSENTLKQILTSQQTVGWLPITSPIGGTITHADVRVGQTVQTTDHLYHVVDPSTVWIVGEVLEADVAHLRKGQEVKTTFAAVPNRSFQGQINHVRLKMNQRSRTQSVVVAMDNRDALLRPGMFGRADIEVQIAKDAVFCPADALIQTRHAVYVLVQRGEGKFVSQPVKLGLRHDGRVEVLDGLFPGDHVVVIGNYLLASLMGNEHKARVKDDPSSKPPTDNMKDGANDTIVVAQATVELPTNRQVFATSRVEGRVTRFLADPSQPVRAGQVLAEVDSLQLRNLQLELLQSVAKMRWAKQSLAHLEGAGDSGVVSKRTVWQIQNDLEVAAQVVASLHRKLVFDGLTEDQVARLERTDLTAPEIDSAIVASVPVCAPAAGWLVGFDVVPGQVVQPQNRLFEIDDLSKVWAKGYVFEQDAAKVRVGQEVRVTFSAYPDLIVKGNVVRTAPMLESSERVLPVWIEVENPDLRLKEGMLAKVLVSTESSSGLQTAKRVRPATMSINRSENND